MFKINFIVDIKPKEKNQVWSALSLAWQLGYTIAIPVVVFGLLGRFLDKRLGTSPLFLLIGILISLVISSVGIYKKTIDIIKQTEESPHHPPFGGGTGQAGIRNNESGKDKPIIRDS